MEQDSCAICSDPNDDTSIPLSCSHRYHYECINYSVKLCGKECPYCRKKIRGKLDLILDKHLNKMFKTQVKETQKIKKIKKVKEKCIGICKSGKRKGEQCSSNAYPDNEGYCRVHKKVIVV